MSEITYQDKWTRWHDKPCINGEPKSNNGWIYTAYGKYLDKDHLVNRDLDKRLECYKGCRKSEYPLKVDRSPNDPIPPLSKDEVIGMVSLGLMTRHELAYSHWNFCNFEEYTPKKLTLSSIIKAAKLLYAARKEHRNYIWENKVEDAYPLAFLLPPEDQYYVIKHYGKSPGIFRTLIFYINTILTLTGDNKSAKMLKWLQLEDMNHPLLRFVDKDKFVRDYFGEEHPFVKGLE